MADYGGSSISVIRDSGGGVEESFRPLVSSREPEATVVRDVLLVPRLPAADCSLLSIDGRKVLDLKPGANNVRALAPGVYFVRGMAGGGQLPASGQPSAITKIVIAK